MVEPGWYKIHDIYLHTITLKHGSIITVSLRKYNNANGNWPENLDQIRDSLDPEILVDPINGGSFVYKLTTDSFMLYSKGKNNIDDGARRESKIDYITGKVQVTDITDDILIWPPELEQQEENDNNDQQQKKPDNESQTFADSTFQSLYSRISSSLTG